MTLTDLSTPGLANKRMWFRLHRHAMRAVAHASHIWRCHPDDIDAWVFLAAMRRRERFVYARLVAVTSAGGR
jgi:hypothetical protein